MKIEKKTKAKTITELQDIVMNFSVKNKMVSKPEHLVLDLNSEAGEVAKEILKMTNYGKKKLHYSREIELELGDVLYSIISIANSFDINLEDALYMAINKYRRRISKGGGPGSEND